MSVDLRLGDCLDVMRGLEAGSVDAVVTDPPYSSGGAFRGDRAKPINDKYAAPQSSNTMDFGGDSMDARAWQTFSRWWMAEANRLLKPGGYVIVFTDWRQLPSLTDLFQISGFIWRGVVPWDKGPSSKLPNLNYFRHQCEYAVWGTKGPLKADFTPGKKAMTGIVRAATPRPRVHPTEKPLEVLAELVVCAPPGGLVLDPFAGSGTTGIACLRTGRKFIGIERDETYFRVAQSRIQDEIDKHALLNTAS